MKRGLKTIYKKKRTYQLKVNFTPVLQLLEQAINKVGHSVLNLLYNMLRHKYLDFRDITCTY